MSRSSGYSSVYSEGPKTSSTSYSSRLYDVVEEPAKSTINGSNRCADDFTPRRWEHVGSRVSGKYLLLKIRHGRYLT